MPARRILVIHGHPDADPKRYGHALADAYVDGARAAGHEVRRIDLGCIDFPLLRRRDDWEHGTLPPALDEARDAIAWAQHLVLVFPLWLGDMPALLKGFLEQVARPGFAIGEATAGGMPAKLLAGRSARVVVTMGMPAVVYRWWFRAHSVASLERNILSFVGFAPVRRTLIGLVEGMGAVRRSAWIGRLKALGARAA
jgi:putative NADPH-quinone reductase